MQIFRKLIQVILSMLRSVDIDIYEILKSRAERRMWRKALPKDLQFNENGLCVAVPLRSFCSEAQVGRDFVRRLMKTSIQFSLFDLDYGFVLAGKLPESEIEDLKSRITSTIRERNVLAFINGAVHGDKHYVYASQPAWEFESGLLEFNPKVFGGVRHVVLNSDFCTNYFQSLVPGGVKAHKIRYGYDESWASSEMRDVIRRRYGIPESAFVVMFHFMFGSSVARKNPQGALDAFISAFGQEKRAHLLLKVAEVNETSTEYQALVKAIAPIRERVTIVNGFLARQEILNLLAASDVYLSLHRGEGLGIGMLEAMAVGTPVVCTNYGGNTEFCKSDTAFLVDYTLVSNCSADRFYVGVKEWPEPCVATAAKHLRSIFENPALGKAKANCAGDFVREHFALGNFGRDVREFMVAMSNGK